MSNPPCYRKACQGLPLHPSHNLNGTPMKRSSAPMWRRRHHRRYHPRVFAQRSSKSSLAQSRCATTSTTVQSVPTTGPSLSRQVLLDLSRLLITSASAQPGIKGSVTPSGTSESEYELISATPSSAVSSIQPQATRVTQHSAVRLGSR